MDCEIITQSPEEDSKLDPMSENDQDQRSLDSLHRIATQFVRLLQAAEGGELDIRQAAGLCTVEQKRHIYDITNVLQDIGLVKTSKNLIKWIGGKNTFGLKCELKELQQQEYMLDIQRLWLEQSVRNTLEEYRALIYVNYDDVCNVFSGNTVLAVRAPSGTRMDVPIPKAVHNSPAKYQLYIKSINGPIDVVLLNKRSISSVPVVLSLPPPDDILHRAKLDMSGLSKETMDLHVPKKEIVSADLIAELIKCEVLSPLRRVFRPPANCVSHLDGRLTPVSDP
ncbi:transcription factor E2F5-like isoform X2 [Entelurus aequoreus]|uniref:transcription factor E2F5-like isoform X2 n=1 Tax=Entelurus aequoreus TaxID=161455 RepID=UPI002B1D13AB|nr:transcription factor E2F5-like isoform X2 [Entelurus aequoreus]